MAKCNIYCYGSVVYGVNSVHSDRDMIVVNEPNSMAPTTNQNLKDVDVTYHDADTFQSLIDEHEVSALECFFLDDVFVLRKELDFDFKLSLPKLRKSFSAKASNSWCKGKKKMLVEGDPKSIYIGRKSVWHSFRMLGFGIQIAKHGRIVNYKESNHLWNEMVLTNKSWDEYNSKYKKAHNELSTEFRKFAPKT